MSRALTTRLSRITRPSETCPPDRSPNEMDGPLRTRGVWGCIRGSQRRSARPEEETPGKLRRPSQGQASQAYPSEVFDLKPTSTLPSFVVKSGNGNHPGTP